MRFATLATAVVSFAYAAFGQTGGTITGVISDPTGAVLANAPVQAKNTATGVVLTVATSATGNFTLNELPAGTYEIDVAAPGFKKYARAGITVQQLQITRVDVALEVGSAAESVTVNEDAPLLKTESGDISHNVTTTAQDDLPMMASTSGGIRVSTEVVATIPGVNGIQGTTLGFTAISINGSPAASERIRIDGLDATYTLGNTYYSFGAPSVDSLQEVAIQTSNFAAEYGQSSGAVLSYTMKSGSNQFHGSLYEYLVNEDLNSHGSYSHLRPKVRSNDYGGTVGGPVWIPKIYNGKDKTFFFFSFETHPTTTTNTTNYLTVPTAQYRVGNFSAATAAVGNKVLGTDPLGNPIVQNSIYDPATQMLAPNGLLTRSPFPNNIIPPTELDPVALKIQSLIPQPQGPFATGLIQNYVNPYTVHAINHIPSIKIDHSVNSKIKLSYNWGEVLMKTPGPPTNPSADGFPTLITNFLPTNWPTTSNRLNYDQTLKPTLLLHLGGAFVKSSLSMPPATTGYNPTTQLGLNGPFTPLEFPAFIGLTGANNTGGLSYLGTSSGIDGEQLTLEEKTNFNANLSWVKNNHTFKFGSEASIEGYPNYNVINTDGVFGFSAAETGLPYLAGGTTVGGNTIGLPYASFLLGLVDNYNVSEPAVAKLGKHSLGFYAQDSWKVTRKLTLDYGLRYDFSTASTEEHGLLGTFDPTVPNTGDGGRLGGVIYGANCACNFSNNYKLGFGPRLGVAYQLNSKTVLRGGAAVLYNGTPDTGIEARSVTSNNMNFSPATGQPAMTLATGVPLTYAQIAYPNFNASHYPVVAVPGTPGAPVGEWIDKNAGRPSRSYQWSVGVQREIVRNLVAEAAYVGNRGIWWPTPGAVNYNANTPQALLADGLDITQASARTILAAPIGSAAAGPFMDKLPYSNFPLTATVAQSLRPYPQFAGALSTSTVIPPLWAPLGDNWYNSLQAKVTKRFSHGLTAAYNFTWSKSLDNGIEAAGFPGTPIENDVFNRGQNKYLSSLDRPLVSNLTFTYIVPAPSFTSNKIVKSVLRDWQLGALLIYSSGAPIAVPAAQTQLASYTFETASYFNRVPGQPLFLQDLNCHCFDPTKTLVLNPAAWAGPAPGTWGTSPAYYNDFRSQRHPTENFNVGRTFRFRESMNLSVRAEFINIFNRTVLPAPSSTNPLAPTTCYVSGVSGPAGACSPSTGAYASGFGFESTTGAALTPRTGQIVARFRF
jgi:hypothetical protein